MKANNTFLRSVMGLLLLAVGSSAHATTYTVADQYALLAKADGLANQQVSLSFSAQAQSSLSSALLLLVQVNNQVVDLSALSGGQFNRTYQLGGQPITSLLLSLTSWGAGYLVSNVSVSPFSSDYFFISLQRSVQFFMHFFFRYHISPAIIITRTTIYPIFAATVVV